MQNEYSLRNARFDVIWILRSRFGQIKKWKFYVPMLGPAQKYNAMVFSRTYIFPCICFITFFVLSKFTKKSRFSRFTPEWFYLILITDTYG